MKATLQRIYKALAGRLARNICFWALLMSSLIHIGMPLWKFFDIVFLYFLMMVQVYVNNLVLVPKFLVTKRYFRYFALLVPLTLAVVTCYTFSVQLMMAAAHHPREYEITILNASTRNADLSVKYILWAIGSNFWGFLGLTLVFTMGWYMMNYGRQQKKLEETQKKQIETELLFLKGQINPHFLFNTLNNLYALAVKKADQAPDAIIKLSAILRYLLYESNTQLASFEKEKEVMQAYIDLELLRLTNRNNLHFSITSDGVYNVPPLLWLPVLENVFKHGTRFISDDYKIDYSYTIENSKLTICAKNNYKAALSNNGIENSSGIGLSNLEHRLDILYPGKYKMTTKGEGDEFTTDVEITLK